MIHLCKGSDDPGEWARYGLDWAAVAVYILALEARLREWLAGVTVLFPLAVGEQLLDGHGVALVGGQELRARFFRVPGGAGGGDLGWRWTDRMRGRGGSGGSVSGGSTGVGG
jgi:hypothetical protein